MIWTLELKESSDETKHMSIVDEVLELIQLNVGSDLGEIGVKSGKLIIELTKFSPV